MRSLLDGGGHKIFLMVDIFVDGGTDYFEDWPYILVYEHYL